ncbi:MAG: DNA translocase FtsK [Lachnospiraceae bacterium]|nr:DNA translocase FtsK [Lachnospiraceae bacterium]
MASKSNGRRSSGKSSGTRKTSRGGNASYRKNTRQNDYTEEDYQIRNEVILILLFAAAVILFLCNFGVIGTVGNVISDILFGIFGLTAYIAPVLLFLGIAFGMINEGSRMAKRKLIAGVLLFLLLGVLSELIQGGLTEDTKYQITEIFLRCSERHNGGGILAGSLTFVLYHFLSLVGTMLVVVVIAIICIVILTEKSIVSSVKDGSRKVAEKTREEASRYREQSEIRKEMAANRRRELEEEREKQRLEQLQREEEEENERILRRDKKVSGVMLDTTLAKEEDLLEAANVKDDIHEITLPENMLQNEPMIASVPDTMPVTDIPDMSSVRIHAEHITDGHSFDTEEDETQTESMQELQPEFEQQPMVRKADNRPVIPSAAEKEATPAVKPSKPMKPTRPYVKPPFSLLKRNTSKANGDSKKLLMETAARLQQTLHTFGVNVTVTDISQGPAITRYELQPEQGVKVSKIVGLADDIKLNLAATDIRIEAPIPGKAAVGIEVPNKENAAVGLRELLESDDFQNFQSNLAFIVGKDIAGKTVVADIAKMPHMLIAGSTGSGKSVCINTIIMSLLYKSTPEDVKMIMIDPKVVELSVYNGIPHLLIPVVTDPKKAAAALNWGVAEMTERYKQFADYNVRDLKGFNKMVENLADKDAPDAPKKMPQIVIIVDELADLMMVAPGEVEESICRLAQLARAAGIHLIIATQRPSVDVITGLIKANMPSRVAFAVSSGVDSRTILDMNGAEKLLGKGDMLFYPQGYPKPARIQGAFVSDNEVSNVVDYLKNQNIGNVYAEDVEEKMKNLSPAGKGGKGGTADSGGSQYDELFLDAGKFIIEKDKASIGMLQRVFKIGFNRAARIMDQLCEAGVVGEEEGTKPRKILMSEDEFQQFIEEYV